MPAGPKRIDVDPVGGGVERARDDLVRRSVAAHRVDRDARGSQTATVGRAKRGSAAPRVPVGSRLCESVLRDCPWAAHREEARSEGQGYGAGVRSGSISRPLYVLHVGQTRCGRLG